MKKPKIIIWDIESSHNLGLFFGTGKQYIRPENILQERFIFCISYKWYGQKKIHTISILDNPGRFKKDIHDDYHVLKKFQKVIEKADAHVAHFGDGFDMPMLNARLIMNGLKPLPEIKSFDTCKIARRYFNFNSNKLDYLAKALGYKGKLPNPQDLWKKCFFGDKKALKHMARHNRQDIDILEFVYEKLMPFVKNYQINMSLMIREECCVNPSCGSMNIIYRGYRYTRTNVYRRFQCKKCGSWGQERQAIKGEQPPVK